MSLFTLDWKKDRLQKRVEAALVEKTRENVEKVFNDADRHCPVGTRAREGGKGYQNREPGSMKESGRVSYFKNKDGVGGCINYGGKGYMVGRVDTFYALFVEIETAFLRIALRRNLNHIKSSYKGIL